MLRHISNNVCLERLLTRKKFFNKLEIAVAKILNLSFSPLLKKLSLLSSLPKKIFGLKGSFNSFQLF